MKKIGSGLAAFGLAVLIAASHAMAASDAIQTMARITSGLNHFASDEDKEALAAIVDSENSTEEEAAIAMAISNLQHKVTEQDSERLVEIVDDDNIDADVRDLAAIVLRINHSASDSDKAKLAALAGE